MRYPRASSWDLVRLQPPVHELYLYHRRIRRFFSSRRAYHTSYPPGRGPSGASSPRPQLVDRTISSALRTKKAGCLVIFQLKKIQKICPPPPLPLSYSPAEDGGYLHPAPHPALPPARLNHRDKGGLPRSAVIRLGHTWWSGSMGRCSGS
jgi:hypothetical protein